MVGRWARNMRRGRPDQEGSLPRGRPGRHPTASWRGSRPHLPSPADPPHELLAISRLLFDSRNEGEILRLAMDHLSAVGPYRAEAGYLRVHGRLVSSPQGRPDPAPAVDRTVRELTGQDGPVAVPGRSRGRALALHGPGGLHGYLLVTSRSRPTHAQQFLLAVLVRLTAAALSVAVAHRRRQEDALELHRLRRERATLQRRLISLVVETGYQRAVHEALAEVTASGGGEEAITSAVHELTGFPVLVEDRFGRLRSWTGPGRPDPYPEPDPARREEMLREVARRGGPVRIKDRLISVLRPRGEVLGVLALVDPLDDADEYTLFALEHAAISLALEMSHLRHLAEVELRLHRELVDDLLGGTDETSAYARSEAFGHDLHRIQYVVVVQWKSQVSDDAFARTVGRVASAVGMPSLVTRRSDHVVLVAEGRPHEHALYEALARETGTNDGTIGVSARCDTPDGIPGRYQEALRALEVRRRSRKRYGTTFFDNLGLYRILGPGNEYRELEAFVQEWLGQLTDYDGRHRTALVETLSRYFDCGGNYAETADSLTIHRSTLRYRLQRIREISGHDLTNVEDRLNLQVATRVWKIMLGGPG
ncbi:MULTISPECIES: PucR family transcriptional regulator [Streptomyces]|uniref:Transcriptional regulator n=1 Tax=Streptomyces scabiei (strain 87.22) TaxID=680198 RepID=C9Z018_STRSW|nr:MULTISPECIES: helix-turn-helix domain-containing protein [Streptomyces]MBP5872404.1 transcriptional regulator [Streptomyces sp. LBUM 1485]KFG04296.1 transcriptional regulator [Streptomyces scabiei]MBP5911460.1 transcriptional regulator [Streptomyces sp. LBUM 1486]MDX2535020.1 helix-turn-helix domain-containing protein [Streptomyces scabiei]MDX2577061.1 helix-turn-helix domain-containing protein [Streptomyces scabiei]